VLGFAGRAAGPDPRSRWDPPGRAHVSRTVPAAVTRSVAASRPRPGSYRAVDLSPVCLRPAPERRGR